MTALDLDFSGRVALVTGGASGIGLAVVEGLAVRGAAVASLDLGAASGVEGVLELEADVRDPEAVERAVARVEAELDGLDVVVQSAGVTRDAMLWKLEDDAWRDVLDVNLTGAFHVLRAAVPRLRARGGGAIVNVSSINGERGKMGQSNYAASKGGLIALTKTAARELGHFGIRVNAVAPGLVRTPMTEDLPAELVERALAESCLGRVSEPDDVAAAILFLASDLARQITGHTLRVDAGQYL